MGVTSALTAATSLEHLLDEVQGRVGKTVPSRTTNRFCLSDTSQLRQVWLAVALEPKFQRHNLRGILHYGPTKRLLTQWTVVKPILFKKCFHSRNGIDRLGNKGRRKIMRRRPPAKQARWSRLHFRTSVLVVAGVSALFWSVLII
jgi:hypothetical protein